MQKALADATLLVHPDPTAELFIVTDALDVSMGAVLHQRYLLLFFLPLFDYIAQFTTEVRYVPGPENVMADALSRVEEVASVIDY